MPPRSDKKQSLKKILELLKYSLSLDDEEIIRSTVESVIEILEEEVRR